MEAALKQRPSDCLKIAIVGPESTGKTTLAKQLAIYYNTCWVKEFMRDYLQKKWSNHGLRCAIEDLMPIAKGQIKNENDCAVKANKVLFCDTCLLELKVYSEYYFEGFFPEKIFQASKNHSYDYYFLTDIDIPWEADDLRDRPQERSTLFRIFERELQQQDLPYQIVSGSESQRVDSVVKRVEKLLNKN